LVFGQRRGRLGSVFSGRVLVSLIVPWAVALIGIVLALFLRLLLGLVLRLLLGLVLRLLRLLFLRLLLL
jgi:hypothetical protein